MEYGRVFFFSFTLSPDIALRPTSPVFFSGGSDFLVLPPRSPSSTLSAGQSPEGSGHSRPRLCSLALLTGPWRFFFGLYFFTLVFGVYTPIP